MNDVMHIAVAANQAFARYLCVMLTSLLENNRSGKLRLYLLSADIDRGGVKWTRRIEELVTGYGQQFQFLKIDRTLFPKELPFDETITMETYFRLKLPELLPEELERVLYLDADLIVNQSLRAFYETDFEGKSFCVCRDVTASAGQQIHQAEFFANIRRDGMYFNAGVLLFNLAKLRETTSFARLMEQAVHIRDDLVFHDQDLLNYVFHQDVRYMEPERYNLLARTAFNAGYAYDWVKEHTAIVHYAGPKPWRHREVRYALEAFWWEYAKKTPYYTELLEEMLWPEIQTGYMDQLFRQLKQENDELRGIVDKCMRLLQAR